MPDADTAQITTPPKIQEKTPSVLNLLVTKASFLKGILLLLLFN